MCNISFFCKSISVYLSWKWLPQQSLTMSSPRSHQLKAVHEQLAALSQGPIVKPKRKKEKKDKKKKKKPEKHRGSRVPVEEDMPIRPPKTPKVTKTSKMPKTPKTKSSKGGSTQGKRGTGKKSNKSKWVLSASSASTSLCHDMIYCLHAIKIPQKYS